jgi:integrase
MAKRKYDYDKYIKSSEKLKKFLELYKDKPSTHRAYNLHLVRYFQKMVIDNIDEYIKDTRLLNKKEKIKYLDKIESDLKEYWININKETNGKTPYIWLSAIKMFLITNKSFELDDVFLKMQKNGHGNNAITNTKTPTKEELLKIFSYSNPESKALFMFQLTSGQRIDQVVETTFDNIDMTKDFPRIFYPKSKTKNPIKTRITPEAKHFLQQYLEQRDKFIAIRNKRGEFNRKTKIDTENKIFPMTTGNAEQIWARMVKNAGLYKLDPNTHKPEFGTHCLRRYFLSHFSDREWGDFFSGHITQRSKEYRQYCDEKLDEEYIKHKNELAIFESQPDLTETNKEIEQLKSDNQRLKEELSEIRVKLNEYRLEKLERLNGFKKGK